MVLSLDKKDYNEDMTEKIPTIPQMPPSPEVNFKKQLIEALRTKGSEDPETRQLLEKWTKEEEARVYEAYDSGSSEAFIELNRKRARLYLEAGYVEEALANLESAAMQAENERMDDLRNDIMDEIDSVKGI